MPIAPLGATESGPSSRTKVNQAIAGVNQFEVKIGEVEQLAALTRTMVGEVAGDLAEEVARLGSLAHKNTTGSSDIDPGAILPSKLTTRDWSNVYPDPDCADVSLYAVSAGAVDRQLSNSSVVSANVIQTDKAPTDITLRSPIWPTEGGQPYFFSARVGRGFGVAGETVSAILSVAFYSDVSASTLISSHQIGDVYSGELSEERFAIVTAPVNARRARFIISKTGSGRGMLAAPIVRQAITRRIMAGGAFDTANHPFALFSAPTTAGSIFDLTDPTNMGVDRAGRAVERVTDFFGRSSLAPYGTTLPKASVQLGNYGMESGSSDSRLVGDKALISSPPATIVWAHISLTDTPKAAIWQHEVGAAGRLQLTANARYNGSIVPPAPGLFNAFINGAANGHGVGGQPRAAPHPVGAPGVFALVLRPEVGSSEFWRNGVLIDTFTAPPGIPSVPTNILGFPGGAGDATGQFMGRMMFVNRALTAAELDLAVRWAAEPFGGLAKLAAGPYVAPAINASAAICLHLPPAPGFAATPLFEKAKDALFVPASTTKVLTAVTALRLAQQFGIPQTYQLAFTAGDETTGSGNNLNAGDVITFRDALANMMLPSSNETATMVARIFGQMLVNAGGGGTAASRFVDKMNEITDTLGMAASEFKNPHGLPAAGQITTAADMAELMREAVKYPELTNIWGLAAYDINVTGPNARTINVTHSVTMIGDVDVLGGKTGTITPNDYNLVLFSKAPFGNRLVTVILRAPNDAARFADARSILDAVVSGHQWPLLAPIPR